MRNSPARILLADDSPANCKLVQACLSRQPYELTIAGDGREAVELFQAGEFDLVLMDILMPGMDGHEATRRIREWEQGNRVGATPIVALTALRDDEEQARQAGCTTSLKKPLRLPELLALVSSVVDGAAAPAAEGVAEDPPPPPARPGEPPVVRVEPELRELIPEFLTTCRADLQSVINAIEVGDFSAAASCGHRMDGYGGGYGFGEITTGGGEIEEAAKRKDGQAALARAESLLDYLDRVRVE
ncbi:MAG: hypothetical protein COZ06_33680 [Armatimonadetes bacterium CG_4_10_14_3_um_filter_66_18]|nr:response regulator [Armatimonadota bacterium]PIU95515.1 MAG: hypothetical protein COS65_02005 [Armatimonadetes bacterium CG06_land_8_20_14_3_00_66_21]PIX44028.1 MAG: hypothetical protein COZ57_18110 [Armatimonadetes bacterium CG_4_8_14_3_um_filter_66_20]PIY37013.1 MAG: hypothetical protein COZ06_33680 [Armatimonadetes bacterium CG_4_10_14_3_um_filter_66_18]PIZ48338.1 MAG: hypothetical protein COY42_06745 [Armatimonadetes bacterium CG_4_10_14_0_8_um_filter_66_14]PJB62619.1 MAG: hypothetical 